MKSGSTYAFRAVHADGKLENGLIEAVSREAAVALIGGRGIYPIDVRHARNTVRARARARVADMALGLRALASLLEAGLPISRALAVVEDLAPGCWTAIVPQLKNRISQGDSLATALRESMLPLPPHVLGIIEAGEAGGGLAASVSTAAELLENRSATTAALWNALSYPIVLAVTGTASIALLVGIVLPRFAELMVDAGQALPVMTRLVLGINAAVHVGALPGLLGTCVCIAAWRAWTARPQGRRQWHGLLLALPAVGQIRRSAGSASTCATLAALLRSGIQLTPAIPYAARAAGDAAIEAALLAVRTRIIAGESFSAALRAEQALTTTSIRFVRIGEETGGLSQMLQHAASIDAANAVQRVKRLIRILEPAVILVFGAVVLGVAAALLQVVYGLKPSL